MDNTLWGKLFHIARNFGDQKDLDVVNFLTGKGPYKKHKSKNRVIEIQERWNARQQKRTLSRILSSKSVPNQSTSKEIQENVSKKI